MTLNIFYYELRDLKVSLSDLKFITQSRKIRIIISVLLRRKLRVRRIKSIAKFV